MKLFWFLIAVPLLMFSNHQLLAQSQEPESQKAEPQPAINVLDRELQLRLDDSVKQSLAWLALQQRPDGSFPSDDTGQPAVTSLCILAFMANGESISEGQYSAVLQKAIDYLIAQQKPNGLISLRGPAGSPIDRTISHQIGKFAVYNHSISALALSESYGQLRDQQAKQATSAIEKAIAATIEMQDWKRRRPEDQGGWRYIDPHTESDSDLSITAWMLMSLRSAKNAGFDVPKENIDKGVTYVESCFIKSHGTFNYLNVHKNNLTRAMAGAGVLALAHSGKHKTPQARKAGDWILKLGFDKFGSNKNWSPSQTGDDRYHYGLLTCCHAMYQLGGKQWSEFYPPTVKAVLGKQNSDGSWPVATLARDAKYGQCYTTSICILSLSAANDLLPIFQR